MTAGRLHLLGQAALCYEQAGEPAEAARCRESAGELVAAANLYRTSGDLALAASCYHRAGRTEDAATCLLILGRPEDAARLWEESGDRLEAAWALAVSAQEPQQARHLLAGVAPAGRGESLRLRIATAVCDALERRPGMLATELVAAEQQLPGVTPASEQARLTRWAVQAADLLGRPDLAALVLAAAYRCGVPGTAQRWRDWARGALGGIAGVPERDR